MKYEQWQIREMILTDVVEKAEEGIQKVFLRRWPGYGVYKSHSEECSTIHKLSRHLSYFGNNNDAPMIDMFNQPFDGRSHIENNGWRYGEGEGSSRLAYEIVNALFFSRIEDNNPILTAIKRKMYLESNNLI